MSRRRGLRPATLFAAIDVMVCFAGILLMESEDPMTRAQAAEDARRERMDEAVKRETVLDVFSGVFQAADAIHDAIPVRPPSHAGKPPAPRRDDAVGTETQPNQFVPALSPEEQEWQETAKRIVGTSGMRRDPDAHLYLRPSGIYRDGSDAALSDKEIKEWLRTVVPIGTPHDDIPIIALWQENGANNEYIRMLDIDAEKAKLRIRVEFHGVVLPTGVHAGPEQKGSERPAKTKGAR